MKPIRFYVMEDIPDVRDVIIEMLHETNECEVIGSADHIQTGYEEILRLKPDALMLDIQLNGGTAFELLRLLKLNQYQLPPIVIMTGNAEFEAAQEAVDVAGLALVKLLEKPFWKSWEQDFPIIKSAILARMSQLSHDDPDMLLKTNMFQEELYIRSSHMTYRIILADVLYLDAEKGFSTFVIKGNRTIKVRKTLTELLSKLPPYFCRISRDKAVNIRHLDQIDHESDELFLDGCKENFFIGEPYKAGLKTSLGI
jgi:two-component system LytT family response regulator